MQITPQGPSSPAPPQPLVGPIKHPVYQFALAELHPLLVKFGPAGRGAARLALS